MNKHNMVGRSVSPPEEASIWKKRRSLKGLPAFLVKHQNMLIARTVKSKMMINKVRRLTRKLFDFIHQTIRLFLASVTYVCYIVKTESNEELTQSIKAS